MAERHLSVVLAAAASLAGCNGQLLGNTDPAGVMPGNGLTPGGAGGGVSVSTTPEGDKPADCQMTQVSAAPLRRLTREQYDNTIRDLLGIEGHPSLGLAADEKLAAFFSNSISPVSRCRSSSTVIRLRIWRRRP